ncbi:hypothetical protein ACWIWK_02970 [Helicobacter sp. 23-1048]
MYSKMFKISVACAFALLLGGCSQNLAKFSVVSTGNVSLAEKSEKGDYVEGKDCIHEVLFWSLGNRFNRVSGAVGKALEKAAKKGQPADALVNADIRASYWSIFFYGRNCIIAKGQATGIK